MRIYFQTALGAGLFALLIGCGSSDKPKVEKMMPERPAIALIKGLTSVQVKNNLMSACSQARLYIKPDLNEVTCIRHKKDVRREQMLSNLVNDEFARQVTDTIKFVITTEGQEIRVVGNAYIQYARPLGVEIDATEEIKRINLLDDDSFAMMDKILKQAGGPQQ
jgi:hypothetical protein